MTFEEDIGDTAFAVPKRWGSQKARWVSWVTPELWEDKPALEAWMTHGIDGWAAGEGYEPAGSVLGIHELRRADHGEGLIMIEAIIFRRYRKKLAGAAGSR